MKLISFEPHPDYVDNHKFIFKVEYKGEQREFILKEKPDWPLIWGEPVEKVEKWLLTRYGSLAYLAYGELR